MIQGQASESILYLTLAGSPALGILFNAITIDVRKANETAFVAKTLVTEDWVDLGGGFYALKWSTDDMDTLGSFLYKASGAGFDNLVFEAFQIDPAPMGLLATTDKCIVSGNIVDLGGEPSQNLVVYFRPVRVPRKSGNSLIAATQLTTYPDALGNFSVALIREQDVMVEVDGAGVRHQITVPDQATALILDLLPPIP